MELTGAGLETIDDRGRFAHSCNATLAVSMRTISIHKPAYANGNEADVLPAILGAALSGLGL